MTALTKLGSIILHEYLLLSFVALLLCVSTSSATTYQQTQLLVTEDADGYDAFGWSVAISGNLVVAGALADVADVQSGSAYIFDASTGKQLHKLVPSHTVEQGVFGASVAIEGRTVVIGAQKLGPQIGTDIVDIPGPGTAYIFDAVTGQEIHQLTPSDSSIYDYFGAKVAVSGNLAVITATGNDQAAENAGAAYVFDVTTGQQLHQLIPSDIEEKSRFGGALAVEGNLAVIGAGTYSYPNFNGVSYVFDITTGEQLFKLTLPEGETYNGSIRSISASDGLVLIGAPGVYIKSLGHDYSRVDVFDMHTGQWLRELTLGDDDDYNPRGFGLSTLLDGNLAMVSSSMTSENGGNGTVHIFDVTTGELIETITAAYDGEYDRFGFSLDRDDETTVVGAIGDVGDGIHLGAVHVYQDIPEPASVCLLGIGVGMFIRRGGRAGGELR